MTAPSLFVGGPKDGLRMQARDRRVVFRELNGISAGSMTFRLKDHVYREVGLVGNQERFHLFAYEGLTGDDIMRLLIAAYPGNHRFEKEPTP